MLHQEIPTITGSAISTQAGTVLYGSYTMDYKLPGGDILRMLANHDKKTVQLLLLTHNTDRLISMPGERKASLVANTINQLNRYLLRVNHYKKPLTLCQKEKKRLVRSSIEKLRSLLEDERELGPDEWTKQEALRRKVIAIIEDCRSQNLLIATNPIVSEGSLDKILYETRQMAQAFQFNRLYPITRLDQLDFHDEDLTTCFVWDSELHIGHNEDLLNDALRVICKEYRLNTASALTNLPANRFKKLASFFHKLWSDGRDWINYLAISEKSTHEMITETRADGLSITNIKPYYVLEGTEQKGYLSISDLMKNFSNFSGEESLDLSFENASEILSKKANGSWIKLNESQILLRSNDKTQFIHYFEHDELFYPSPCGDDLYTLSQLGKRHLYLPEKAQLQLKAFLSRIPTFFLNIAVKTKDFTRNLFKEFMFHVHETHDKKNLADSAKKHAQILQITKIQEALKAHGLLPNGQSLESFITTEISKSHYKIVREEHVSSPPLYKNPLHRLLGVARHFGGFFVDVSEKNPILGTLALAAYFYGGSAVIIPEKLTNLLMKLHLNGLIKGIEPTQDLAKWLSHGTGSEAISAAVTYWQGVIVGGDFDQFFIQAIDLLKEEPADVAIIVSLAISLGYGICQVIPSLAEEMGTFPYINYAALGAKGGAAIYDTVMHPGDDWLLGTIKWFLRGGLNLLKILIGPFIELYFYGFKNGLITGLKKSAQLVYTISKQIIAALTDLILAILTIPLSEVTSLFIHVPFRGLTKIITKTLSTIGNLKSLGTFLLSFAERPGDWHYMVGYRLSPLYGFKSPFHIYVDNSAFNAAINIISFPLIISFQITKNLILLPLIDLSSFIIRIGLSLLDPLTRFMTLIVGKALLYTGLVWDNTAGKIFSLLAIGTMTFSNKLDDFAGRTKQFLLSTIQIARRYIYNWAFAQEEELTHKINTDTTYFLANPMRLEHLPHDSSTCLLRVLLEEEPSTKHEALASQPMQHPPLFIAPEPSLIIEESTIAKSPSFYSFSF